MRGLFGFISFGYFVTYCKQNSSDIVWGVKKREYVADEDDIKLIQI